MTPIFGVTYSDDAVYVLGGSPAFQDLFTSAMAGHPADLTDPAVQVEIALGLAEASLVSPYVAKIDIETMAVEVLELDGGLTLNYIGGLVAHENGNIYVAATSKLFEIDPVNMTILRQRDLPLIFPTNPSPNFPEAFFTTYNGLQVSPTTGDIVLRGSADFSMIVGGSSEPEILLAVDPSDLSTRIQESVEVGTSRMTIALQGDTEYLYLPGETDTERFEITGTEFVRDSKWAKPYRTETDGSTQAPALVYMGKQNSVAFTDNGSITYGVTAPLRIFSQSTKRTAIPVRARRAVSTSNPGGVFFLFAGDPFQSGMVVVQDVVNGIMAGWQVVGQGAAIRKVWQTDQYLTAAGAAIAVDQGHLYADDRECDDQGLNCTLFLVVLDLATGDEIARTEVAGTVPPVGHTFVAGDAVFYLASEAGWPNGFVTKVSAR